jgi:hypothetical protein
MKFFVSLVVVENGGTLAYTNLDAKSEQPLEQWVYLLLVDKLEYLIKVSIGSLEVRRFLRSLYK